MAADPKAILEKLLTRLGFEATVNKNDHDGLVFLDVQTNDPGRLIGRQGQTLSELQYITNRLIFKEDPESPKVTLDVGNYRSQQRDALLQKAMEAAEKVLKGQGYKKLGLHVFGHNAVARKLYESMNFQATSLIMSKILE